MTELQARVLAFVTQYIDEHHHSPSIREIQDAIGAGSTHIAHAAVHALVAHGRLRHTSRRARSLEVVEFGPSAARLAERACAHLSVAIEADRDGDAVYVCTQGELRDALKLALYATSGVKLEKSSEPGIKSVDEALP